MSLSKCSSASTAVGFCAVPLISIRTVGIGPGHKPAEQPGVKKKTSVPERLWFSDQQPWNWTEQRGRRLSPCICMPMFSKWCPHDFCCLCVRAVWVWVPFVAPWWSVFFPRAGFTPSQQTSSEMRRLQKIDGEGNELMQCNNAALQLDLHPKKKEFSCKECQTLGHLNSRISTPFVQKNFNETKFSEMTEDNYFGCTSLFFLFNKFILTDFIKRCD